MPREAKMAKINRPRIISACSALDQSSSFSLPKKVNRNVPRLEICHSSCRLSVSGRTGPCNLQTHAAANLVRGLDSGQTMSCSLHTLASCRLLAVSEKRAFSIGRKHAKPGEKEVGPHPNRRSAVCHTSTTTQRLPPFRRLITIEVECLCHRVVSFVCVSPSTPSNFASLSKLNRE